MTEPSQLPPGEPSPEPSPERQRQIEQAQFLVQLYKEHRPVIDKASNMFPVEHLGRADLGDDVRQNYYFIVLGALMVQEVPGAEARILANHIAVHTFNELRAMPEPGHA